MKIIRGLLLSVIALFRTIYKWIDKHIVVPITKFIVFITDKLGGGSGKFERWITRKSTLIFISLILAIAAFLYVDNESNILIDSSAEVLYDQEVDVTYNAEAYVIEGLPDSVDVTLIGRKVDLYLAKQLSNGKVGADLSNLGEGTHKITLNYESPISSVSYKLDPSTVNITIYQKVSKTMSLTTDVINEDKLDSKLSISDVSLEQTEVIIKGAEHTLEKVATVKALVDVSKIVNPSVGVTTLDDVKLVAYDADGNVVDVEMVPGKINATIKIESPNKEVPIKIVPTGSVEFGKAIDSISCNVTKVTVYGSQSTLDSLEYIPVEVDVSGLSSNKDYTIVISKPSGISDISETTANVSVKLDTEVSMDVSDVYIETINLDSNYKAVAIGENSSKTTVVVKGTESVLKNIDSSNIKATVDLSEYGEGEYEVEVKVTGDDVKATYESKTTKIKIRISKK
jgi:YbbR domain-containing protein